MNDKIKENWIPIVLGAVMGLGGGGGASTFLAGNHSHPELQKQIISGRYKADVERLKVSLQTMDNLGIPATHPIYISAKAQLQAASALLAKSE
jgi:hypothetical protein